MICKYLCLISVVGGLCVLLIPCLFFAFPSCFHLAFFYDASGKGKGDAVASPFGFYLSAMLVNMLSW